MSNPDKPPAGWHPAPNDPQTLRYWDGDSWTDSYQPATGQSEGKSRNADGVIIFGYIMAVLMPLIGFIVGLTQINKNRHGLWIVVVSVAVFVLALALLSAAANDASNSYRY